jgi:glucosamine--fructose-6-phosphate aminotransferase (isomerizing)
MCGIIGYVGGREAAPILLNGLGKLEYRGYDSAGMATLYDGRIDVRKGVGKVVDIAPMLNFASMGGSIGIAHTRWATHGRVTKENSHPHLSCNGEVAIVHNGIIENYEALRKRLEGEGHVFRSECDSETFAHLLEGQSLDEGYQIVSRRVEGSYAILALSNKERKLFAMRDGSPLHIGIGQGEYFVASDRLAFVDHTDQAIYLEDGEHAILDGRDLLTRLSLNGFRTHRAPSKIDWVVGSADKESFKHFMQKEIFETPQALTYALGSSEDSIREVAEMIHNFDSVFLTGMGSSTHAAITAKYWFADVKRRVFTTDSSELENEHLDEDCLVVAITQSGETKDTLDAMKYAKSKGAKVVGIVNNLGTSATRNADKTLLQRSGPEIAVCATKTFQGQLMMLARLSEELGRLNGVDIEWHLEDVPDYVRGVLDSAGSIGRETERFCDVEKYFFIGNGINYPTAKEAALKFKEISYKYAEGMTGGFHKHGTISLVDSDFKTIAFIPPSGKNRVNIESNIQEIRARNGEVLKVGFDESCGIRLPDNIPERLTPFIFSTAGQLIAYYYADRLGNDVDKPRHLAKSVTVR